MNIVKTRQIVNRLMNKWIIKYNIICKEISKRKNKAQSVNMMKALKYCIMKMKRDDKRK